MNQNFYCAFESRYRGSRELIRERLTVYLPFIKPLLELYQPTTALDLGCGRGEWLELLQDNNFQPQGVDLDDWMFAECTERGLPIIHGDAIAYLSALGDDSQCIVSGFHIAEHIAFDDLEKLIIQSLRVLKPGGLLILETPNPENVVVGTNSFYLDPTHQRPIPPQLLSFLAEHQGFVRVHTVRLQEQRELHERSDIGLMDVLGGVSPDYSVVAQKAAAPAILAKFDVPFATHYGIELYELAARYDGMLDRRMSAIHKRLAKVEAQAGGMTEALGRITALQDRLVKTATQLARAQAEIEQLQGGATRTVQHAEVADTRAQEQRVGTLEAQLKQHQARIDELGSSLHRWRQQACALEAERNALRQSASWRITAPLRFAAGLVQRPAHTVRGGANAVIRRTIVISERPLSGLMAAVLRRPQLSHRINQWLLRYPALYQQLLDVARRGGIVMAAPAHSQQIVQAQIRRFEQLRSVRIMHTLSQLSNRDNDDSVIFLRVSNDAS